MASTGSGQIWLWSRDDDDQLTVASVDKDVVRFAQSTTSEAWRWRKRIAGVEKRPLVVAVSKFGGGRGEKGGERLDEMMVCNFTWGKKSDGLTGEAVVAISF